MVPFLRTQSLCAVQFSTQLLKFEIYRYYAKMQVHMLLVEGDVVVEG